MVGSAVRRHLPGATFASRRDADLTDLQATRALFARVRPRRVVHLAALTGGVRFNRDHNADLLTTNLQIDANVLTAAREIGVERLVGLLSSCAFEIPADRPASEADLHRGAPFAGNLGYAMAKRALDLSCRLHAEQYGCRFSTLAPVTIYGPHDHFGSPDAHVVAALISRAEDARQTGTPLDVWGTGEAVRQFVYVDDVARLLVAALGAFEDAGTVIVTPDEGLTIGDLARRIAARIGFDGPVLFTGDMEGQRFKRLRSARFDRQFPSFDFTALDDGLAATVAWFRQSRTTPERRAHVAG
jgi:GDP-L-fucose synthase